MSLRYKPKKLLKTIGFNILGDEACMHIEKNRGSSATVMEDGVFPDYRAKSKKSLEEERNNAYVAVTRAKRRLYISYSINKMMPWGSTKIQKPYSFLKSFLKKLLWLLFDLKYLWVNQSVPVRDDPCGR